jgi:hypothetical protein
MNRKLLLILILATSLGISNAGAQTGIIVETNFDLFEQGQLVMITGNAEEKSVAIKVKDPTGISILVRLITTDSDGNFELEFRIPQTATPGDYQVIVSTVIDNIPVISTATFEVVEEGERVTPAEQAAEEKKGGCLIATAAFGSELAPQVQFLREIRDNTVLQTESGTSFMAGFNQFYYSFSPAVADYERENPAFKEAVKITLTPLLTSLTLLQYVDIDSESEMLGYGIGVILLNIGMYFVAPAILLRVCIRKISQN